jgi:hypothetical protein
VWLCDCVVGKKERYIIVFLSLLRCIVAIFLCVCSCNGVSRGGDCSLSVFCWWKKGRGNIELLSI